MANLNDSYQQVAEQALPYMQPALQTEVYRRTIKKVARGLSKRERGLSRIMHFPLLEAPVNLIAQTLMRPAGLLGGGIVSLIGTIVLLYLTRYQRVVYSFSAYFLLFISGFILGLLMEGLSKFKKG